MVVVVNCDALAQESDFQIERRPFVFLCWMQDRKLGSVRHQIASRMNAHSHTDWAIEDQAKTWTQQPVPMTSKNSAHVTSLPIGFCFYLDGAQARGYGECFRMERIQTVLFGVARFEPRLFRNLFPSRLNTCPHTDEAIQDHAKQLN